MAGGTEDQNPQAGEEAMRVWGSQSLEMFGIRGKEVKTTLVVQTKHLRTSDSGAGLTKKRVERKRMRKP